VGPPLELRELCLSGRLPLGSMPLDPALTAARVDSVSSFEAPEAVVPKPLSAEARGGKLVLKLEPKSVSVVSLER
jgi:alpha-L-arabinofuranosidase